MSTGSHANSRRTLQYSLWYLQCLDNLLLFKLRTNWERNKLLSLGEKMCIERWTVVWSRTPFCTHCSHVLLERAQFEWSTSSLQYCCLPSNVWSFVPNNKNSWSNYITSKIGIDDLMIANCLKPYSNELINANIISEKVAFCLVISWGEDKVKLEIIMKKPKWMFSFIKCCSLLLLVFNLCT